MRRLGSLDGSFRVALATRIVRGWAALAVVALVAAVPSVAHAQWDLHDERDGLELAAYGGYGAFTNDALFRPTGTTSHGSLHGSFGMQFELAYRVMPVLSAGLHGTLQFLAVDASLTTSGTSAGADAAAMGPYVRFHPLALVHGSDARHDGFLYRSDAYVGIGVDLLATVHLGVQASSIYGSFRSSGDTAGVALPLVIGYEYLVYPNVYVGVMGEWSYWTAASACGLILAGSATLCSHSDHEPEGYLFLGLGARGHFNFLH